AADNADLFHQHLHHGSETVGGATGVGNHVVLRRIVLFLVHAQHEGNVFVGRGSGDDDFFNGLAEVNLGYVCIGEAAGGFNHDLRADGGPGKLGGILLGIDFDLLPVDDDEVTVDADLIGQVAQDRIVLEQMSESGRARQVIDGDEINLGIAERGAQN